MTISPEIETARLKFRPFTLDDVDDIHQMWTHPDVRKYLCDDKIIARDRVVSVVEESIASFQNNRFGLWAVFLREQEILVGFGGFWYFYTPPQLELMYGVAPEYWNQGFATEIAQATIKYGFEQLGFERIMASADAPNLASLRVMQKAGMKFDSQAHVNNLDLVYYSISRAEFETNIRGENET